MRRTIQNPFRFTDLILVAGVIISGFSLYVNSQNNNVLDSINGELKRINDNELLEKIANGNNHNNGCGR